MGNIPRVIGLTGRAKSGKSTAAAILHDRWGYVRERFANPLKDMCRAIGMVDDEIEGHLKLEERSWLCGRTPRYVMQTLGTEWGRMIIGEDFWARLLERRINQKLHRLFVVEDCRFLNEAKVIRDLGGIIIRVTREEADSQQDVHISEREMASIKADYTVQNNAELIDLALNLDKILEEGNANPVIDKLDAVQLGGTVTINPSK